MQVALGSRDGQDLQRARLSELTEWTGLSGVGLLLWLLLHGYEGITHDARLYSFQAMARVKPDLLGNDIYLRFGSQDDYTIFSAVYAALIRWVGFEPASALLTLVSHAAFVVAAWVLARRLMPPRLAWLSVGLLLTLPTVYGASGIWSFFEGFVTPRLAAESLVLLALAAVLEKRHLPAILCLALALLLHPIMAAVGIGCALFVRYLPERAGYVLGACLLAAGATLLADLLLPAASPLRFDATWLSLIKNRQDFLFLSLWDIQDWARAGIHLSTLLLGALVLPHASASRRLSIAALVTATSGLIVSGLGGDWLEIALVVQAQPWRALWLSAVVALLLLPVIGRECWQRGPLGQSTLFLILVAWMSIDEPYTAAFGVVALGSAAALCSRRELAPSLKRLIFAGSCAVLVLVLIRNIANTILFAQAMPDQSLMPAWVREFRSLSQDGVIPALIFGGIWLLCTRPRGRVLRPITVTATVVGCAILLPASAAEWNRSEYTRDFEAFAEWRQYIPPGEEVMWIDGAVETWALLERPRYLTTNQMASMLFSREAAIEMRQRALRLAPLATDEALLFWSTDRDLVRDTGPLTLTALCEAISARFIVTRSDLAAKPLALAPAGASLKFRGLRLFRCER